MATDRFSKLFTVDEANQLIPRLELIVRHLQECAQLVRTRVGRVADQSDAPPDLDAISRSDPEVGDAIQEISESAEQIEDMGCLLKDIDLGLVDFPTEMDGDVVFLCWQYGEPQLVAWHAIDEGFRGRQRLSGSKKVILN